MPKRIFLLTWLLIKGGDFSFGSGGSLGRIKKKQSSFANSVGRKAGMTLLYIALILYAGGISFYLGRSMTLGAVALNIAHLIPQVIVPAMCIGAVIFGFVYVVTAFYHTNNTELLLSMPFQPSEIIAGRYLQVMSYEYMTLGGFFLPFMLAYAIYSGQGPLFYLVMLLVIVFIPFLALAAMTILIMLLLRFTKFFKNKDRFTIVSTLIILLVSFGISFGFNFSMNPGLNNGSMPTIDQSTANSLGQANLLFLGADFAVKWLNGSNTLTGWLYGLAFVAATAAWTALLLFVAQKVYFKGVMSANSGASRNKKLDSRETAALAVRSGRFRSFVKKEVNVLMRTPAFFSNNVLMCFLMPVLFLVPSYLSLGATGFSMEDLRSEFAGVLIKEQAALSPGIIMMFIAIGASLFLSGTNGIAAGAISREGASAYLMKLYPYAFWKQILAKYAVACAFSLATPLILLIAFQYFLKFPMTLFIPAAVLSVLSVLVVNLLGLAADMAFPKIHWTSEQQAAKQNYNMLIEMFGSAIPAAFAIGLMYLAATLSSGRFSIVFVTGCLALLIQIAILGFIINKLIPRTLQRISV